MDDQEFLLYCETMTNTERCGFVPKNIARLMRLAGQPDQASAWENQPNRIIDHCHEAISNLVYLARNTMKEEV